MMRLLKSYAYLLSNYTAPVCSTSSNKIFIIQNEGFQILGNGLMNLRVSNTSFYIYSLSFLFNDISVLAQDAIQAALKDYKRKQKKSSSSG